MATHSSVLAWRVPWIEEPGGLQSMGFHRVGHNLGTKPPSPSVMWGRAGSPCSQAPAKQYCYAHSTDELVEAKENHSTFPKVAQLLPTGLLRS